MTDVTQPTIKHVSRTRGRAKRGYSTDASHASCDTNSFRQGGRSWR